MPARGATSESKQGHEHARKKGRSRAKGEACGGYAEKSDASRGLQKGTRDNRSGDSTRASGGTCKDV